MIYKISPHPSDQRVTFGLPKRGSEKQKWAVCRLRPPPFQDLIIDGSVAERRHPHFLNLNVPPNSFFKI